MWITVTQIISDVPFSLPNHAAPAYRIRFESSLLAGAAGFVPAGGARALPHLGARYAVETGYTRLDTVRRLTPPDLPSPALTPRAQPGDYDLIATVVAVTHFPVAADEIVDVAIGDLQFTVTAQELGHPPPQIGDTIAAVVYELSLWDTGL